MQKLLSLTCVAVAFLWLFAFRGSRPASAQTQTRELLPLQLEEQIPAPGVLGRLDHLTADFKRKRLFVSALGNNTVEVIDTFAGKVIHSIKGLGQPQSPLYVAEVDKLRTRLGRQAVSFCRVTDEARGTVSFACRFRPNEVVDSQDIGGPPRN